MATKTYSKLNFHKHTFCIWNEVLFSEIAEMKISYVSQSGSQYIFTDKGLYRISNHWGRVANCHWRLIPLVQFKNQHDIVAYANWSDFYSNDDTSKLFFIKIDEKLEVNFYHKQTLENPKEVVLRNAKETAKTIRTIKEVLTDDNWARHLSYVDLEALRKEVIAELIDSNKSFLEIKKQHL